MTNNNSTQKTYVNSIWVDEKVFTDGGSIIKLNIVAEDLIKFLKENKDESGRVRLSISRKKGEVPEGKSKFYTILDTWKPSQKPNQAKVQGKPASAKASNKPVEHTNETEYEDAF